MYIQSRMMGCDTKVSLHESGLCQWSMTEEWVKKTGARHADRHIVRWHRSALTSTSAIHLFRIIIPESELREVKVTENLRKVTWLHAPPHGYVSQVECYLAPPSAAPLKGASLSYSHLASLPLKDSKWFIVFLHEEAVTEENSRALRNARHEIRQRARNVGIELKLEYRAVAFLEASDVARGMIEVVPVQNAA